MPDILDFQPAETITPGQQRTAAANLQQASGSPGLIGLAGDAIGEQWVGSWAWSQFQRSDFERDPHFYLTSETVRRFGEGLDADLLPEFRDAVSLDHAYFIREQLRDQMDRRRRLDEAGFSGGAVRVLAAVTDPAAIAATAATAGLAGPAVYGARLSRPLRFIRGGLVTAGTEGVLQSYLADADPTRDANDVLWTMAWAGILGGAVNAARRTRPEFEKLQTSLRKEIELDEIRAAGLDLTPEGQAYWAEQLDPVVKRARIDRLLEHLDLDADELAALKSVEPDELLGRFSKPRPVTGAAALDAPDYSTFKTPAQDSGVAALRFDMVGRLVQSPSDETRRLGSLLARNSMVNTEGDTLAMSATEWVNLQFRRFQARWKRSVDEQFDQWADDNKVSWWQRGSKRLEFAKAATPAVRRGAEHSAHAAVHGLANAARKELADMLGMLKRSGVKGFDKVNENLNYLTRVYSLPKVSKLMARLGPNGRETVKAWFVKSLLRGSDNLAESYAEKIAEATVRRIERLDETPINLARMLDPDQSEILRNALKDVPGITEDLIEDMIYATGAKPKDAGVSARALRRIQLDESFEMPVKDAAGNSVGRLSLEDFTEDNLERLVSMYVRDALGDIAMTRVYHGMARNADDTISSFDTLLQRLELDQRRTGIAQEVIDRNADRLRLLHQSVRGLPLERNGQYKEFLRAVRSYNYISKMGQMVFAQIPEMGVAAAQFSIKTLMKRLPGYRELIDLARSKNLSDQVLREIEELTGIGTEYIRGSIVNRLDPDDAIFMMQRGGRIDRLLQSGAHLTSLLSGQTSMFVAQTRWFGKSAAQHWADLAAAGKLPSAEKLAALGLNQVDAKRITDQIRKHSTMEVGFLGRKLRALNYDAWDDQGAVSLFAFSLDKWANRVVQTNDIGQVAGWMTHSVARTLLQFRMFQTVAWSNHTLRSIRTGDMNTFFEFTNSLFLGSLSYVGLTYGRSIGRDDRQEYLDKMLTPERIALAAFQRGAFSSLIPPAVDTIVGPTTFDTPFSFGRTTGLSGGALLGNPTFDTAVGALRAGGGVLSAASDERQFDQSDAAAIRRLLPFQNVHGIQNVLNAIEDQFPDEDEE